LRSLLEDAHAQTASVEESLRETKEALDGVEIELSERRNQLDDARMNAAMAAETSAREHEQIRKEFEDKISALLSSSADLSLQLSNTQSLLTECEKKLVEQKEDTDNERNESERVKKELSASQEALSAAFRDMASVDANLTAALESASTLTSRAESAESKCKSLDEEKSKLFSLVEEALLERDRLTNEISLVKAELAVALMKKETVDTGAGGNQVSGFPKEAAVGPDWNDPNEMRVASGDSSAVMALAEGGGGVSSISNISNGDLRVMAYDDTPALRSLVNELKTQASALEIEVNDLRNKLSASLSFGEKSANDVAALELSLKRYTAREEELSTQIANIRRELASAHEAVSSAEKRAAESEMNAERVSMKIAAYQREAETSAMEARVAQEQLSMYLLRQPSGHLSSSSSSTSFSSIGGSNGGLIREVVNEEIIQQQKNEIARLEKALETASNRAREEAERVAALTSQGLEQHRLLQRARAEANLKSADVDAHLEGLVASEARARNELNEAKRVAEAAKEEKASVIRILDAVLTDVPKAISSVLGVKVPPEMLQAGESSLVSLLCQSSLVKNSRPEAASNATANLASLPALPPTPFSAYKGGNMSYNNGGGGGGASHSNHEHSATAASSSSSSLSINEDDLAREMHAAATQLRLVTLQKAAMAKELTQVYKAVEVLEGNLGKTRRENSKLLATLSAVQSSRRLGSSLTSIIDNEDVEGG
jgi:chromosome segregation ATPase